ncbi:MAG: glycerol-3-phosphate 1-O-acyltransferase PlsY [bacterium]
MLQLFLVILLSYLAGTFPTAIIISRLIIKDDIRKYGSGNAGATNVFRVMGWKPGLIVITVDIAKGMLAVLVIAKLASSVGWNEIIVQIIAGFSAIIGHIWTVFAGFRGGKGVGTAFGVFLGLTPLASLITFTVWVLLILLTRYVSIASLSAGFIFGLVLLMQKYYFKADVPVPLLLLGGIIVLLVFYTHRSNIKRLIKGKETKIGEKRLVRDD